MSIYSTRKSKSQKNGPSGAPGPASASPWRAKRRTLPKSSTFLSQLKGDPLEKKQIFEKKSHNVEKLKGGPFGIFKHPICCKISKKLKGGPLEKKNKFSKKSRSDEKKLKGGLARYGMLRGKTGKTFLVQFARPNGAIIFCRTFKNYFGQFV